MMKIMKMSFMMSNSLNMMNMNKLNDKIMLFMMMIMILTMMMSMKNKKNVINKMMMENQNLELMWTLFPMFIIMIMSYMSIMVLYMNNELKSSIMTIKITGNQWFWNYSYLNMNVKFNSYLMNKYKFSFNLMDTDYKLIVPFNTQIMLIVSSMDVIHSWTMPSLNIKIDAIPGQVNNSWLKINKVSIMFGQCSEICGINHSFMPIMMESITMNKFLLWMKSKN